MAILDTSQWNHQLLSKSSFIEVQVHQKLTFMTIFWLHLLIFPESNSNVWNAHHQGLDHLDGENVEESTEQAIDHSMHISLELDVK